MSLVYINDSLPGYTRIKRGDNFNYKDEKGNIITKGKTLRRIQNLSIPPAWQQRYGFVKEQMDTYRQRAETKGTKTIHEGKRYVRVDYPSKKTLKRGYIL